jgi:DNA-binding PadR family transcriptional regulator
MATGTLYSELEYLVLGMVGMGINSGYAIRKQMVEFRGGRWSAESGSVYRVLRRLLQDGPSWNFARSASQTGSEPSTP